MSLPRNAAIVLWKSELYSMLNRSRGTLNSSHIALREMVEMMAQVNSVMSAQKRLF